MTKEQMSLIRESAQSAVTTEAILSGPWNVPAMPNWSHFEFLREDLGRMPTKNEMRWFCVAWEAFAEIEHERDPLENEDYIRMSKEIVCGDLP